MNKANGNGGACVVELTNDDGHIKRIAQTVPLVTHVYTYIDNALSDSLQKSIQEKNPSWFHRKPTENYLKNS